MLRRDLPPSRKKAIKRVMLSRRYKATGPVSDVVEAVCERAGYSCEICTDSVGDRRGVDHHIHHRRPRGAGGSRRSDTNLPSNLLLLCPPCHREVESHRGPAQSMGWLVVQGVDPATVAVLVQKDRWVYLTEAGSYSDDPPEVPVMDVVICKSTRNSAGCGHPVNDHDGAAHRDCCCCNWQHNDPVHAAGCFHCWGRRIKAQLGGAATVGEIAPHMPEHLRPALWKWAVGEYFKRELGEQP